MVTGGGGNAASFDYRRSDVLAVRWWDLPRGALTFEHWVRIVDPLLSYECTLAYSAFNAATGFEAANELQMAFTPTFTRVWKGETSYDCFHPSCRIYHAEWVHMAFALDPASGNVTVFRNGAVVESAQPGGDFGRPVAPRGVLHFGQEADSPWGDFDELQSLAGQVDEVRVWDHVRTPAQLQAFMGIVLASFVSSLKGLNLYWSLDATVERVVDGEAVPFTSSWFGAGADRTSAMVGHLPTLNNIMTYSTLRPPSTPTAPTFVRSSAPVVGSGRLVVLVNISTGAETTIVLPARDHSNASMPLTITIESLPERGVLKLMNGTAISSAGTVVVDSGAGRHASKGVLFMADAAFAAMPNAAFTYRASNGTHSTMGNVSLQCLNFLRTAPSMALAVDEDTPKLVVLGGVDILGNRVAVRIDDPPTAGTLWEANFTAAGATSEPSYLNVDLSTAGLRQLGAGDVVRGASVEGTPYMGVVIYEPPVDAFGDKLTTFNYSWISPALPTAPAELSPPATVTVSVAKKNDAPAAVAATLAHSAVGEGDTVITLSATDVDPTFVPNPFYRITSLPKHGKLYQYSETRDPSTGALLSVRGDEMPDIARVPTVIEWASAVLNASSQFSLCGRHCFNVLQCDEAACPDLAWHARQILGKPDVYPRYGDIKQGWDLSQENTGHEWIELAFHTPVHVGGVGVYETYKPGAVVGISTAETYRGHQTQWTQVWAGPPQLGLDEAARIFAPSICQVVKKTRYLRLDLDTATVKGWNNYDSVSITGSLQRPPGVVADPLGRVVYVLSPFVHRDVGALDRLSFAANDCTDEGSAAHIDITSPRPLGRSTQPISSMQRSVLPGLPSIVSVDVGAVLSHFSLALATNSDGTLEVLPDGYVAPGLSAQNVTLEVVSIAALLGGASADSVNLLSQTTISVPGVSAAMSLPARLPRGATDLAILAPTGAPTALVTLLAHVDAFTYQLRLQLTMDCEAASEQGLFGLRDSGACVPCSSVDEATRQNMPDPDRFRLERECRPYFEQPCPGGMYRKNDERGFVGNCTVCEAGRIRRASDVSVTSCYECAGDTTPSADGTRCEQLAGSDDSTSAGTVVLFVLGAFAGSGCLACAFNWNKNRLAKRREEKLRLDAAEESNRRRRAFVRYVFHELRVPFTTVALGLETLQEDFSSLLPADGVEYLSMMKDAAQSVSHILDDVLSMQKIEDGAFTLDNRPFFFRTSLKLMVRTMRVTALHKSVSVEADLDPALPEGVVGDPHRLRQVLANLVSNAVKFTKPGSTVRLAARVERVISSSEAAASMPPSQHGGGHGAGAGNRRTHGTGAARRPSPVVVRVDSDVVPSGVGGRSTPDLTVSSATSGRVLPSSGAAAMMFSRGTRARGISNEFGDIEGKAGASMSSAPGASSGMVCEVRFTVADEGPGISEEDIARLFKPYVQIDSGALQKGGGTGLGLSISKVIVDLFGGRIGVLQSIKDKGTTFFVDVPFPVATERMLASLSTSRSGDGGQVHRGLGSRFIDRSDSVDARGGSGARSGGPGDGEREMWPGVVMLVVDDVSAIRKMVGRFLERFGIRPVPIEDGARCLEYVRSGEAVDAILLDNQMPRLTGPVVATTLRGEGFTKPIFGFTGNALAEDQEHFRSCGANIVLTKPLKTSQFLGAMRTWFPRDRPEDTSIMSPTSSGSQQVWGGSGRSSEATPVSPAGARAHDDALEVVGEDKGDGDADSGVPAEGSRDGDGAARAAVTAGASASSVAAANVIATAAGGGAGGSGEGVGDSAADATLIAAAGVGGDDTPSHRHGKRGRKHRHRRRDKGKQEGDTDELGRLGSLHSHSRSPTPRSHSHSRSRASRSHASRSKSRSEARDFLGEEAGATPGPADWHDGRGSRTDATVAGAGAAAALPDPADAGADRAGAGMGGAD